MNLHLFVLASVLSAALIGGCRRAEPEIDGYGDFHLGKTTLNEGYVCQPPTPGNELTYCSNNPSPMLGGQRTSTDLYFRGSEPDSPLVEILVAVRTCKPNEVGAALIDAMGEGARLGSNRMVWRNSRAVIVAQLPAEDGVCEVNFVAPDDSARIAELTK